MVAPIGFYPASGPAWGGTWVTVTGSDLQNVTGARMFPTGSGSIFTAPPPITATSTTVLFRTPPAFLAATGFLPGRYYVQVLSGGAWHQVPVDQFRYTELPDQPPAEPGECVRRAWLVLPESGHRVELEDPSGSWVCPELDIGWPEIRDVTNNRPDLNGVDDRTKLFGSRPVSARIVAGTTGRVPLDEIARQFGEFMVPDRRPELHWTLDTPSDAYAERMLTLRAADFSNPVAGPWTRDIHLAWVAPDPIIRDPQWRETIARPAWGTGAATRAYNLTFPRVYAGSGGGGGSVNGSIEVRGDVNVYPMLRIFGPATSLLWVRLETTSVVFRPGFEIPAGRYVDVDCANRTVTADDGSPREGQIDWTQTTWLVARPNQTNTLLMTAGNANQVTHVVATWRDGWVAA